MVEVFANALFTFEDINQEVWYSSRSSYVDFMEESRPVVDSVLESDTGLYRMEKTYHRTVNDPMALKMNGISHSTSTLNADALEILHSLGFSQREHWSHYTHTTIVNDSLLGVKYVLSKTPVTDAYILRDTQGEISVYENPYALPILVAADRDYAKRSVSSSNPFEFQNELVNAMLGEYGVSYFTNLEPLETTTSNVKTSTAGNHYKSSKIKKDESGMVTYTLEAPSDDPIYVYFKSDYENTANLYINGELVSDYFNTETYCIMPVGQYEQGERFTVSLEVGEEDLYVRKNSPNFYYLDMALYEQAFNRLQQGGIEITSHTPTKLQGVISVSEDESAVYTSIPYEGGWTIKVDGEPVPYIKGADALITFAVSGAGEHSISMSFVPPGLVIGAIVSTCALVLFVLCMLLGKVRRKETVLTEECFTDPEAVPEMPDAELNTSEDIIVNEALFPMGDSPEDSESSAPLTCGSEPDAKPDVDDSEPAASTDTEENE